MIQFPALPFVSTRMFTAFAVHLALSRLALLVALMALWSGAGWAQVGGQEPGVPHPGQTFADTIFGRLPVTAFAGNGRLTVSLDSSGAMAVCRWPSPSHHDQLLCAVPACDGNAAGLPEKAGALWGIRGIRTGHTTSWIGAPGWEVQAPRADGPWPVLVTESANRELDLSCRQTVLVHPEHDLLAIQIEGTAPGGVEVVHWYASFAPCDRFIPSLPFADWALDRQNNFVTFVDMRPGSFYCFRPHSPGLFEWQHARKLAAGQPKSTVWSRFGKGIWIGAVSAPPASVNVGPALGEKSIFSQTSQGWKRNEDVALGPAAAVFTHSQGTHPSEFSGAVFVAFGEDRSSVDLSLDYALSRGFGELADETKSFWAAWLESRPMPALGDEISGACGQALLTLALCSSLDNGGVIRCPVTQPPSALDWPRYGAWTIPALDRAGLSPQAEARLAFYASLVRTEVRRGVPLGSLPAACYVDGAEAVPSFLVDAEACAWVLWSFGEHISIMDREKRIEYLRPFWASIDGMASFLAGWCEGPTRPVLASFDPVAGRDVATAHLDIAVYCGLRSAVDIASLLDEERPQWRERLAGLESLVRFAALGADGVWRLDQPMVFWPTGLLAPDDPRWEEAAMRAFQCDHPDEGEAARLLYFVGLYLGANPQAGTAVSEGLREALIRSLRTVLDGGPSRPDAYQASLVYLAAMAFSDAQSLADK